MTGLGVGPRVVDEMDGREIHDLMEYWSDNPPTHIATAQTRDVVICALGGKPPSKRNPEPQRSAMVVNGRAASPEQFAAMFGVKLPESV
jgi:hypothetical protein